MSGNSHIEHHKIVRPCLGERVSGDAAVVTELDGGLLLGIADVLGHGQEAHAVALTIEDYLAERGSADIAMWSSSPSRTENGRTGKNDWRQ